MASNFDAATGLVFQVKRPAEERTFVVDFSKVLGAGRTLASITDVSAAARGLVSESGALSVAAGSVNVTKVSFKAEDGTDGEDYEVTLVCTDNTGDIVSDDVMIKVRKAGLV